MLSSISEWQTYQSAVALDRDDVNRLRLMRVNVDGKTKIGRQIAADFAPLLAGIIGAKNVPVLLHEQRVRPRRMHRNAMNAMSDFRLRVRNVIRMKPAIDRLPVFPAIIGA